MDGHILNLINQRDQALHNFQKKKIADDFNISPNCEIECNTLFEKLKDFFIITKLKIIKIPHQTFEKH